MSGRVHLSETDVRDMVRLLGENIALKGSIDDKRRHLMAGICRLVQADSWAWAQAAEMDPTRLPVYVAMIQGGFTEESFPPFP